MYLFIWEKAIVKVETPRILCVVICQYIEQFGAEVGDLE